MPSESLPVGVGQLLQHGVVHLRPRDDRGEAEVLRGRADHRRAADVDVLDHLVVGRAAPGRGALERVEVHADEVDELDAVLLGGDHVLGVVAQREQAGVELRVQRLDAAAHDLREAGEVLDRADLEARLGQLARGAAGRDELDAELGEAAREVGDAALVGHRQQRAAHADITRLRHPARTLQRRRGRARLTAHHDAARVVRVDATAPRAISRTTSQSRSCSSGRSASRTAAASVASGSSIARWAMIGPVSTPSSTKWTVTPNTLTP